MTGAAHLWIRGGNYRGRRDAMRGLDTMVFLLECHRHAVGPYGTVRHLLNELIPLAFEADPEIVERPSLPSSIRCRGLPRLLAMAR